MSQGRKISARAHRSARRHARVNAAVQKFNEQFERLDANARESLRQHVGAQQHRCPHDRHGQRVANARGMAPEEIELQGVELVGRDAHVREVPEAGVDAVGRLVAMREVVDDCSRRSHALPRGLAQGNRVVVERDRNQSIECQRLTVKLNHVRAID